MDFQESHVISFLMLYKYMDWFDLYIVYHPPLLYITYVDLGFSIVCEYRRMKLYVCMYIRNRFARIIFGCFLFLVFYYMDWPGVDKWKLICVVEAKFRKYVYNFPLLRRYQFYKFCWWGWFGLCAESLVR